MRNALLVVLLIAITSSGFAQPRSTRGGGHRGGHPGGDKITVGDVLLLGGLVYIASQQQKAERSQTVLTPSASTTLAAGAKTDFRVPVQVQVVRCNCNATDLLDLSNALRDRKATVLEPMSGNQRELVAPYVIELTTSYERGVSYGDFTSSCHESGSQKGNELLGRAQVMMYEVDAHSRSKRLVASADVFGSDMGSYRDSRQQSWHRVESLYEHRPESRARAILAAVCGAAEELAQQANEALPRYNAQDGTRLDAPHGCCAKCGKPSTEGANFCPFCGERLAIPQAQPQDKEGEF